MRSTRGTEPGPYGQAVIRFARSVLADYDRTRDELSAVASGSTGRTRVGAMVVATPTLLMGAIDRLKARSVQSSVYVEEGDLTRLLPRLRTAELDLIVGRLEPGYASPDLKTEALYDEAMSIVCKPGHPLAKKEKPTWADLALQPWVVPPAWASSRVKLNQLFYKQKLLPPVDLVESASFLITLSVLRHRNALGFVARSVALHLEREKLAKIVKVRVAIELPPVGIITMRGRLRTPASQQLIECLRLAVADRDPTWNGKKLINQA